MKYISKTVEPKSLINFKNLKYPKFTPSFENLPPSVLHDIIQHLIHDQGYLCCYTLDEITPETAILVHIHTPKYFPDRGLNYENMFLALRQPDNLPPKLAVGYQSKGETVIPDYLSDERCGAYFRYNTLGEIIPAGTFRTVKKCRDNFKKLTPEQQMAFCTIDLLNLNADHLKQQRKTIFNQVTELVRKMPRPQIQKVIKKLKEKDKFGKYRRYQDVMVYYLENL
ncbi:MAG: hypothetical protein NW226_13485 [Microscillaceae bacterium]|nr:hypothetical protein [Microscillaceae bacterium]